MAGEAKIEVSFAERLQQILQLNDWNPKKSKVPGEFQLQRITRLTPWLALRNCQNGRLLKCTKK